jgi:hypothetical protein
VEEEAKLEKLAEALLKASEKVDEIIEKELGRRVEDIDLTISLEEVNGIKNVEIELGVSGFRAKNPYEEIVEEALNAGEKELEQLLSESRKVGREDK